MAPVPAAPQHVAKKGVKSYRSFDSDEEILLPKKKGEEQRESSIPDDERTEWQHKFEWDLEVDMANKEVFGNEHFREN